MCQRVHTGESYIFYFGYLYAVGLLMLMSVPRRYDTPAVAICRVAPPAAKTGFRSDMGLAVMILPPSDWKR